MVFGTRQHDESLYGEIETVLGQVGLRLAPDKTRVTGIDGASIFSGFASRDTGRMGATGD
ncbi:hypothetical protein [Amycolatopsis keratiniphila]|uniref:hypothetical protein n=1 Tax=Amycolatopsis keratiniphila TaxID=129921 RepID=UPI00087DE5D3|nr:hypothetical protein [Amycolatopsis keratiniphila]SDU66254.1 hypothetical protein SAMN04489733_7907 [Amycolatopsis keratiniphila]